MQWQKTKNDEKQTLVHKTQGQLMTRLQGQLMTRLQGQLMTRLQEPYQNLSVIVGALSV